MRLSLKFGRIPSIANPTGEKRVDSPGQLRYHLAGHSHIPPAREGPLPANDIFPQAMTRCLFTAAPEFSHLAWQEFQTAVRQPQLIGWLTPGVCLATAEEPFAQLGEVWRAQSPIYVRHVCPAAVMTTLNHTSQDVEALRRAVVEHLADQMVADLSFSVQTRLLDPTTPYKPFDVNERLAQALQAECGARLDVRAPQQIVSVAVGRLADAWVGLAGVSLAAHNLSDWAGGVRRFKREPDQISRAEFKLLEAWELFGLTAPPGAQALDLGAAPGGWTRVLRQRGVWVTAVDPAALDGRLLADQGVWHVRVSAESFLHHLSPSEQFTLILNDMRLDPLPSVHLMAEAAPHLAPDGWALITLKLPQPRTAGRLVNQALTALSHAYTVAGARQLFHNRQEVTVLLRQRA